VKIAWTKELTKNGVVEETLRLQKEKIVQLNDENASLNVKLHAANEQFSKMSNTGNERTMKTGRALRKRQKIIDETNEIERKIDHDLKVYCVFNENFKIK